MSEVLPAGYRGQRYEVRYIQAGTGHEKAMGWCSAADGGGLLRSAVIWPEVEGGADGKGRAWVVDLNPEAGA